MLTAVESADRAPYSNEVAEDIAPRELVIDNVGTGLELADGDESDIDGIAGAPESGDWVHDHEYDTDALEYLSSENDRAQYYAPEDGAVWRVLTIIDSTNGESAPSISEGTVVGVPDSTVADGESTWSGRVVQEGYSNGGTTFNRSNSNFIPVGVATQQSDNQTVSAFDDVVRIRVDQSL